MNRLANKQRGIRRRKETVPEIEEPSEAAEPSVDREVGQADDEGRHAAPLAEPAPVQQPSTTDKAPTGEGPRRRTRLMVAGLGLAVLIGISGILAWVTAATSEDLDTARTRDAVLVSATQGIKTLNSLDYRKVKEGLDDWVSVSTGTLSDQLAGVSAEDQKLLSDQKKISTGKVIKASVVDLDQTTATVIAAVEVTVKDGEDTDAEPVVKRNRFSADMVLVKGVWKVENLVQVPVNIQ